MSQKTVMAVYDDRADAKSAVQGLLAQGYNRAEVSLISHAGEGVEGLGPDQPEAAAGPAHGAATGGVLGGLAGLLFGIGLFSIPGVGPAVVVGPIASTLVGSLTGAVMGGMMGVLMDFGVPEDDAHIYSEAVRRGSTIVAVTAPPERVESVSVLLAEHNPVDLASRATEWKNSGWSGFDPNAEPLPREVLATRPPFPTSAPIA